MRGAAFVVALALAGCTSGGDADANDPAAPPRLEEAAIARGLVRDPENSEVAGLYARDTDRLCIVPEGFGYRIGATLEYGGGISCSASGTVSRVGEMLTIEFGDGGTCSFEARYDGEQIRFPGELPDGCAAFCSGRASFEGLAVPRLSDSIAEAEAMRDARERLLCAVDD